jgi:hypothetical protein
MRQQRKYLAILDIPGGPWEQFFTEAESTLLDRIFGFPQEANAHRAELAAADELNCEWLENEVYSFD